MEIDWLSEEWSKETIKVMRREEGKRFKKFYSKIKKSARETIKRNSCIFCGKKCTGFCKSHTVPQFILKNISANGKLFLFNSLAKNAFLEYDSGVSNAGIFHMICNDCDNTVFQDYENVQNLKCLKKNDILIYGEIALKNLLKSLYKRCLEVAQYEQISEMINNKYLENFGKYVQKKVNVGNLDIREYESEIVKCKKILANSYQYDKNFKTNPFFNIIDCIFVPYTVPIAYQGVIAMITDIRGNLINDVYCDDVKYKQELLHLCIFPLENASLITMFTHKSNKRYHKFKTQFLKLSLPNKLSIVNYILFLYTEDMFLSGCLDIEMIDTTEFRKVIRTNPTDNFSAISPNKLKKMVNDETLNKFSLDNHKLINNLLSAEFSMENISNIKH